MPTRRPPTTTGRCRTRISVMVGATDFRSSSGEPTITFLVISSRTVWPKRCSSRTAHRTTSRSEMMPIGRSFSSATTTLPTRPRRVNSNFITEIIDEDLRQRRYAKIVTRFPPEPNGYLHIGHAKSICLKFGLAPDHGGECTPRFDDTNPETESREYADEAKRDVQWLGLQWTRERHTSGY